MKALKGLVVLFILSSVFAGCEKWKDYYHHEKEKNVYEKKNLPMSGLQEVPQRETMASGWADVHYDKKTKMLKYTIKWKDLTGNPTGSHIHGTAARGKNASIKHDFFSLFPKTTSGTFSHQVMADGVAIKEDSLLNGFYYFNLHTAKFPGGEIRGQIEFK